MFSFKKPHRFLRKGAPLSKVINIGIIFCYFMFVSHLKATTLDNELSLQHSIQVAIAEDIWHQKNLNSSEIEHEVGVISSAMPNPILNVDMVNLAADTFRFNQERMTQFKLKLSQQFLRGNTSNLSQKMQRQRREIYPVLAQERQAKVALAVATLWLNAFADNHRQTLVQEANVLLEQLIETAQRRYEVGSPHVSQQAIIMAQVELTALEDRINQLKQHALISQRQLRKWLSKELADAPLATSYDPISLNINPLPSTDTQWADRLSNHPTLFTFIKMHQALSTKVEIAKQSKKAQWGVNASYGFRSDDSIGNSRSDLLSVGVTLDLPLFNQASNNSKVSIAKKRLSNHQTDRLLQLQSMIASARAEQENLNQLNKRLAFYRNKLLPQTESFVQAVSASYQHDNGDFSSIIRAKLSQLNREIESFNLSIKQQLSIVTLNYYLTQTSENVSKITSHHNHNGELTHE